MLQVLLSESNAKPHVCTITGSALPGLGKTKVLLEASETKGRAGSLTAMGSSMIASGVGTGSKTLKATRGSTWRGRGKGCTACSLTAMVSSSMAASGFRTGSRVLKATRGVTWWGG